VYAIHPYRIYDFVGAQCLPVRVPHADRNCALPVLLSFVYSGHDASCPYIIAGLMNRAPTPASFASNYFETSLKQQFFCFLSF